ncbi:hypothetical protein ACF08B_38990 [Streptomyces sp. NPDC015139]|uniref:hypothetical protein n=1 Tax=Streptomyces sp. NPDC015139 TaxID=3364942 RepID=UPI0036FA6EFA
MNREERRAILGDDVIERIHRRVAAAPEPSDELVQQLRRIMTAHCRPLPTPTPELPGEEPCNDE